MAGNSSRRGAVRKAGSKKGMQVGSGGQRRKGLQGKGPTPKATDRPYHKAHKKAQAAARSGATRSGGRPARSPKRDRASSEMVAGRNSVLEALRADVPVATLYIAGRLESDDRAGGQDRGRQAIRSSRPSRRARPVTDGAVIRGWPSRSRRMSTPTRATCSTERPASRSSSRSTGSPTRATSRLVPVGHRLRRPRSRRPSRRSAGMTASAWKTAREPRSHTRCSGEQSDDRPQDFRKAGFFVIGLDMDGEVELPARAGPKPLVVVVGSESRLSRLVSETCDQIVRCRCPRLSKINAGSPWVSRCWSRASVPRQARSLSFRRSMVSHDRAIRPAPC